MLLGEPHRLINKLNQCEGIINCRKDEVRLVIMRILAGSAIFLVTLAVMMARPYRISEAKAAACGAILMLVFGFVSPGEAVVLLSGKWNVFGFFLGLMVISALADQAGVFDVLAFQAGRWARGSAVRLYLAVFAVGVLITAFLSNDATALILTPAVYALVTRLRLPVLPFLFACTFIADTASFILPVSNPINILILDSFGGGLAAFFRYLLLPSFFCIGLNTVLFLWLFRYDLRLSYNTEALERPTAVKPQFLRFTLLGLGLTATAYVVASASQLPVSWIALGASVLLLCGAWRYGCLDWRKLSSEVSWSVFVFVMGMFVMVRGVESLELTKIIGNLLTRPGESNALCSILLTAGGTALGSNLINNVPMSLLMVSALQSVHAHPTLYYATILGADLGPNLTTVGSLATMFWLLILRRKGLEVSTLEYFKLGITIVPLMILVGSLLIWLRL
jgi:arsenical pump membrane protein